MLQNEDTPLVSVVIPTSTLMGCFSKYAELLSFHEAGFIGIVVDHILMARPDIFEFYEDFQKTEESQAYADRIISEYELSIDRQYLENTYRRGDNLEFLIREVLDEIERECNILLVMYLGNLDFQIQNVIGWAATDLIVGAYIYGPRRQYRGRTPGTLARAYSSVGKQFRFPSGRH